MNRTCPIGLLLLLALPSACVSSFVQMQESYVPHDPTRPAQVLQRVTREACEWRLFGFLPISGDNSANTAVADLISSSPKIDNILAVHVTTTSTLYLVVWKVCTEVSGYPVVYKDNQPRLTPFRARMPKAGEKVRSKALATGNVPTASSTFGSAGATKSSPAHSAATSIPSKPTKAGNWPKSDTPAKPTIRGPTQSECESKCGRFAGLWKGSDAIKTTIRAQCMKKCLIPENSAYRKCIEEASKIEDITRCNAL